MYNIQVMCLYFVLFGKILNIGLFRSKASYKLFTKISFNMHLLVIIYIGSLSLYLYVYKLVKY